MSYCTSCGVEIKSQTPFCAQCGQTLGIHSANNNLSDNTNHLAEQSKLNINATKKKEVVTLANQVVLAFLYMVFCEFKGSDAAAFFQNIVVVIIGTGIAMGITYFCVVYQGVKNLKPNYVLVTAILLATVYVLSLASGDHLKNNFFDWFSYVIGFIQVGLLYRVFTLIKQK